MMAMSRQIEVRFLPYLIWLLGIVGAGWVLGGWFVSPSSQGADLMMEQESTQHVELLNGRELCERIGYPAMARNAGIEGVVTFRLRISHTGVIMELEVLESDHPLLEVACIEQLHFSQYGLASMNQMVVPGHTFISFRFRQSHPYPTVS